MPTKTLRELSVEGTPQTGGASGPVVIAYETQEQAEALADELGPVTTAHPDAKGYVVTRVPNTAAGNVNGYYKLTKANVKANSSSDWTMLFEDLDADCSYYAYCMLYRA